MPTPLKERAGEVLLGEVEIPGGVAGLGMLLLGNFEGGPRLSDACALALGFVHLFHRFIELFLELGHQRRQSFRVLFCHTNRENGLPSIRAMLTGRARCRSWSSARCWCNDESRAAELLGLSRPTFASKDAQLSVAYDGAIGRQIIASRAALVPKRGPREVVDRLVLSRSSDRDTRPRLARTVGCGRRAPSVDTKNPVVDRCLLLRATL